MKKERTEKERKGMKWPVRLLLYILLVASVTVAVLSGLGAKFCKEESFFLGASDYLDDYEAKEDIAEFFGRKLLVLYVTKGIGAVNEYCENTDVLYAIYTVTGRRVGGNMPADQEKNAYLGIYPGENGFYKKENIENYKIRLIFTGKLAGLNPHTSYSAWELALGRNYERMLWICLVTSLLSLLFFLILLFAKRRQTFVYRIPLELVTAAVAALGYLVSRLVRASSWYILFDGRYLFVWAPAAAVTGVVYLLHLIARLRTQEWYRYTIVYWLYSRIQKLFELWKEVFRQLPVTWKLLLAAGILCAAELAAMRFFWPDKTGLLILLWVAEKLILIPIACYCALSLKKIRKATKELAAGNLTYQLNPSALPWSLREFGRDLNAVSDSVSLAVEERMKSERLKTELITNVSHDIKTPLTSIINFADLIGREKTDNEKISEYAGLLHKQSVRLKKLMEDLIEASKASTGNLEMNPEPCEVGVLLTQCVGEYEQTLAKLGIDLIVKQCPEPVWIVADTRMLWRIFENLMNNICKYAQKETRVYLSTEQRDGRVYITFKNVSKYPLDIQAQDLTERFVRGDVSRHTEGSGLGLSIVKSLMDMQGGRIELVADGDLFKAILEFPPGKQPEA